MSRTFSVECTQAVNSEHTLQMSFQANLIWLFQAIGNDVTEEFPLI